MSEFFGLHYHYLPAQRMEEYANNAIAISKLHIMTNSVKENLSHLKEQHSDIIKGLNNIENEIINFITLYKDFFKPKLTPHSQIKEHHPNLDLNYFSEINTIEKAYWLGFLFADGWIVIDKKQSGNYYRIGFGQKSVDRERVVAFCRALGLNTKYIRDFEINNEEGNVYHYSEIRFSSGNVEWEKSMAKHLINHGMNYEVVGENGKRVRHPFFPI